MWIGISNDPIWHYIQGSIESLRSIKINLCKCKKSSLCASHIHLLHYLRATLAIISLEHQICCTFKYEPVHTHRHRLKGEMKLKRRTYSQNMIVLDFQDVANLPALRLTFSSGDRHHFWRNIIHVIKVISFTRLSTLQTSRNDLDRQH